MTITNDGNKHDVIEGLIEAANQKGIRLSRESEWRDYEKWAAPRAGEPGRGQSVRLEVDQTGFIPSVQVRGRAQASASSPIPTTREHMISRLACLKALMSLAPTCSRSRMHGCVGSSSPSRKILMRTN